MKKWNLYIGTLSAWILWSLVLMVMGKVSFSELPFLLGFTVTVYCLCNYNRRKRIDTGLVEESPVTYKGVPIGEVDKILEHMMGLKSENKAQ